MNMMEVSLLHKVKMAEAQYQKIAYRLWIS